MQLTGNWEVLDPNSPYNKLPTRPTDQPSQFPHLIIPINSQNPNKAYGNSLNGSASGPWSSVFNFDIPASDADKTCTLKCVDLPANPSNAMHMLTFIFRFLFPTQATLETSAYTFSGNGSMHFTMLNGPASQDTTYANAPTTKTDFGAFTLAPGNAYKIADFACPAGQAIGIWMDAHANTALNYFQDFNPCRKFTQVCCSEPSC